MYDWVSEIRNRVKGKGNGMERGQLYAIVRGPYTYRVQMRVYKVREGNTYLEQV